MTELEFNNDSSVAAKGVANRSFAYGTLAACLTYPDTILSESINSGKLLEGLTEILKGKGDTALVPEAVAGLAMTITAEALAEEYTQLFDVTTPQGAICGLYAGLHYGDRMQVMEEHIRFYNFFGLHMPDKIEELPDHLCTELEFLRFLSTQEAYAIQQGQDAASFQKAQRDFISRIMLRWMDSLEQSVIAHSKAPFYVSLIGITKVLLKSELERLNETQDASLIQSVAIG